MRRDNPPPNNQVERCVHYDTELLFHGGQGFCWAACKGCPNPRDLNCPDYQCCREIPLPIDKIKFDFEDYQHRRLHWRKDLITV